MPRRHDGESLGLQIDIRTIGKRDSVFPLVQKFGLVKLFRGRGTFDPHDVNRSFRLSGLDSVFIRVLYAKGNDKRIGTTGFEIGQ